MSHEDLGKPENLADFCWYVANGKILLIHTTLTHTSTNNEWCSPGLHNECNLISRYFARISPPLASVCHFGKYHFCCPPPPSKSHFPLIWIIYFGFGPTNHLHIIMMSMMRMFVVCPCSLVLYSVSKLFGLETSLTQLLQQHQQWWWWWQYWSKTRWQLNCAISSDVSLLVTLGASIAVDPIECATIGVYSTSTAIHSICTLFAIVCRSVCFGDTCRALENEILQISSSRLIWIEISL